MDVSQFLKSFKKNVAGKTRGGGTAALTRDDARARDDAEDVSDMLHSASDDDDDAERGEAEVLVHGRADRLTSKRYGGDSGHTKRNQDLGALKVLATNDSAATETSRFQRQRALLARPARDTRTAPRADLVASVRAELLRQREQLQLTRAAEFGEVEEAPVKLVEAAMVDVEQLLMAGEHSAPSPASALAFLPAPPASQGAPVAAEPLPTVTAAAPQQKAKAPQPAPAAVISDATVARPPAAPPKKKPKFELAKAMAREDGS